MGFTEHPRFLRQLVLQILEIIAHAGREAAMENLSCAATGHRLFYAPPARL